MKSIHSVLKNLLYVLLAWIVLQPVISNAQYDFSVSQCVSAEEAIAIVDTVLLGNIEPVFKQNITVKGDPKAVGYYNFGYIFGFNEPSGIILSTGFSGDLDESNTCTSQNANGNTTGGSDADLATMSSASINDACIIEFDLMLFNDSVFLSYIFGSEEYHEYVNSPYNDVFGFFVSGPGISGPFSNNAINVAVVPGTNNYVGINNVNCGKQTAYCTPPPGSGSNCELLIDNTDQSGSGFDQTVFDAYTSPFTTHQGIQSYEWYHFKLAIGDACDASYDSGVLLEKGSIVSIPVPEVAVVECGDESDVINYVNEVLLSNVIDENKANIFFSGDPKAVGYFANTEFLQLDADQGIVFSNGYAGDAAQPNECDTDANISTNNDGLETDDDLLLLSDGNQVSDVSIIEFDYRPSGDTIYLNYVFASEDYHDAINLSQNDVFGIFLSGPGIDGEFENNAVNIATIPGSEIPVNSATINFGDGGVTCTGTTDGCLNCEYLIDNSQKTDTAFFALAYDGYTVPMYASHTVEAGEWYHIKIAIADVSLELFDSGIFFAEGILVSDSLITSTFERSIKNKITILPNPAKDYIEVQYKGDEPILECLIYSLSGRLISRKPYSKKVSLSNIPNGMLIIELVTENQTYRKRIIHK